MIGYIAAILSMMIGLVGTVFETRRDGSLTPMGLVAVVLIVCLGIASIAILYTNQQNELEEKISAKAEAADAEKSREAAAKRAEETRALLGEANRLLESQSVQIEGAKTRIQELDRLLQASRRREELALRRSADIRLEVGLRYHHKDLARLLSQSQLRNLSKIITEEVSHKKWNHRVAGAAADACAGDAAGKCRFDNSDGYTSIEALHGSEFWRTLRGNFGWPVAPSLAVKHGRITEPCYKPDLEFQYLSTSLSASKEIYVSLLAPNVPVCTIEPSEYGGFALSEEPLAQVKRGSLPNSVREKFGEPTLVILPLLSSSSKSLGLGFEFNYSIPLTGLSRIQDLSGQLLEISSTGEFIAPSQNSRECDRALPAPVGISARLTDGTQTLELGGPDLALLYHRSDLPMDSLFGYASTYDVTQGAPQSNGLVLSGSVAGCRSKLTIEFPPDQNFLLGMIAQ